MATQASKEWVAHAWAERTQSLPLPWGAWSRGPEEETFRFPAHWVVERLDMAGWPSDVSPDLASLSRAAKSLAVSGKRVSIAIDDPTRPSPLGPILKALVLGLREAGIPDSDIDLVMALGAHGRPASREVRMKVGEWIADRFTVRFHDPHGELSDTGLRLGNTPIRIDRHFFAADLRIGVSTVIPNPFAGFSGGGKIVLPGLASIEALHWLHKLGMMGFAGGVGATTGNRIRTEIDRLAAALPLHFGIACLVDSRRTIREFHFGEPTTAYRAACDRARSVYATSMSGYFDVLCCNAYPKDGEFLQAENAYSPLRTGGLNFLSPGGSVVLMTACHNGRGQHGLFDEGMPLHRAATGPKRYLRETPVFVYAPGINEADCRVTHWEGYPHFRVWDDLIEALGRRHGTTVRVGIFPAGSCQLGPQKTV